MAREGGGGAYAGGGGDRSYFKAVGYSPLPMAVPEESSSSSLSKESNTGAFYLTKTVLNGSAVLQAVRGHFRSSSSYDVVFGKETSIELVIIDTDGIVQSISEQPVFGTIKDLAVLPWNGKFQEQNPEIPGKDMLLVLSDSGKLLILTFSDELNRFIALSHVHFSNRRRAGPIGRMMAVDSSGCFVAASPYDNLLAILSLSKSRSGEIIHKKICSNRKNGCFKSTEGSTNISGTIWSMCFISEDYNQSSKERKPVLAILVNRLRSNYRNELLLLECNMEEEVVNVVYQFAEKAPMAYDIVEVPRSHGFAFLFRAGDILLMDFRNVRSPSCVYRKCLNISASPELGDINKCHAPKKIGDYNTQQTGLSCVCSWSWEPGTTKGHRILFSADSGDLCLIEVVFESDGPRVSFSDSLYKGHPCTALLWLEGGFVAAIAEMADGVVLKFDEGVLLYKSSIQNLAPILDMRIFDYTDEKHDQVIACSGIASEGSLCIIQSGLSVKILLKTDPIYQGVTGTWTVKRSDSDPNHSFLVLSFFDATRVLSVGISFSDVTESVGFLTEVCTLACGIVADDMLVQIHQSGVRVCLLDAPSDGVPFSSLKCNSWSPNNEMNISLGAIGHGVIVLATFSQCILILEVSSSADIGQVHSVRWDNELSCISMPNNLTTIFPSGYQFDFLFVIGTHQPSVEVVSFSNGGGLQVLAKGIISLTSTVATSISGECVPQDVRVVFVDHPFVLSGLRNGMVLSFEWSALSDTSEADLPIHLQLIASRHIGNTPVSLVSLSDSLDDDMIALCDRPWLLKPARHSLFCTSIFFQQSTHVTPICSTECPRGVLFVAENSLHLVEMVPSKRPNVQKFHLGGTPRVVLYHNESRLVLVMRTELDNESYSSDVCFVDPLSGSVLASYKFGLGEMGKCMEFGKVGNEHVLVVGTSLSPGPKIASIEVESTKGRLIVLYLEHLRNSDNSPDDNSCDGVKLQKTGWHLRLACSTNFAGMVNAVCPYLDRYFLASDGNTFYVCSLPNDNSQEVKLLAAGSIHVTIKTLTAHFTTIAVGGCDKDIYFFTYNKESSSLEQTFCRLKSYDHRRLKLVDCVLMDVDTAFVSNRVGGVTVLSSADQSKEISWHAYDLTPQFSYEMGEIAMRMRRFSYRLPADECDAAGSNLSRDCMVAATLLGSIIIFIPLTREEYDLLNIFGTWLKDDPRICHLLGGRQGHKSERGRCGIVDGDIMGQFLELTSSQQKDVFSPRYLHTMPAMVNKAVHLLHSKLCPNTMS